ncbi:zinc transporter ZIP3-like [Octopus sinensis]|uniref:Zinc transporter ZIP3-like n=1 Tax=Octopus sinensis TaxID=2607531 RepID=A0A6P7T9P0_9MOLL|nr:zinc transporter ZIP3-like [Octopus sinensis]
MNPIVLCKIIVLIIVFLSTITAGLLPFVMLKFLKRKGEEHSPSFNNAKIKMILSCLNTFSGGVFLSACFIHLLPEVRKHMQKILLTLNIKTNFPATEFITIFGFFIIIMMEQYVSLCFRKNDKHSKNNQDLDESETGSGSRTNGKKTALYLPVEESDDTNRLVSRRLSVSSVHSVESMRSEILKRVDVDTHNHVHFSNEEKESSLRSVLLLLALSLHTIFDGLTVGLEKTVNNVWSMFTAVIIHKILIGFTLGLQMFENAQWSVRRTIFLMFIFSVISPIGIVIGILIEDLNVQSVSEHFVSALLKALATGTFMYVTFFEILGREISHDATPLQILFAIIGFGMMTELAFFD